MTEHAIPAADAALPNIDRRSIVRGLGAVASGGAVLGALAEAAEASPAVSPDLLALIEVHGRIEEAYDAAMYSYEWARGHFWRLCGEIDADRIFLDFDDLEKMRTQVNDISNHHEHLASTVANLTTPAMRECIQVMWREIRADWLSHYETLRTRVEELREASGYGAAARALDDVKSQRPEICRNLCAFSCASPEEQRVRSEYLLHDELYMLFDEELFAALLHSFAGHAVVRA